MQPEGSSASRDIGVSSWTRRKSVFHYLALPGMYLVYKYTQYKRQQHEGAKKKATEKELQNLNQKIDKLLTRIDDHESGSQTPNEDDECVVCLCAKATMQTFPCGHKVVCRKCFVRTIQIAVTQRCLPLRCVVCRTKILKLRQTRDASPITPPPSRHHIRLPWQRQHSNSPCSRRTRDLTRRGYPQTSSANKAPPFATRAMQSLLIYPESHQPKQAFELTSAMKKDSNGAVTGSKAIIKKQVRFASPIRSPSPSHVERAFKDGSPVRMGANVNNTSTIPSQHHDSDASTDSGASRPEIENVNQDKVQPTIQRTILRNTADMRIPTIKECYQNCGSPRIVGHQAGFASPQRRVTLQNIS